MSNSIYDPIHPIRWDGDAVASAGLTILEHAALILRIPESGNDELDQMIRRAVRRDSALMAMQGMLANASLDSGRPLDAAHDAVVYADAVLRRERETIDE